MHCVLYARHIIYLTSSSAYRDHLSLASDRAYLPILHVIQIKQSCSPHPSQCSARPQRPVPPLDCSLFSYIRIIVHVSYLQTNESASFFHNLKFNATPIMSAGHCHSASLSQNHKAQLANAYNELGKELASQKIRVVGNYTLGKVIGEGRFPLIRCCDQPLDPPTIRNIWRRQTRDTSTYRHACCRQTNTESNVTHPYQRDTPSPSTSSPTCHSTL